jgi:site-specific DNA-methyltransferase (adenine-specific)
METNRIYNENCIETMAKMPDNFIDLTVTSPPYDNLREYKGYSFPFEDIAKELFRVTKDGGVVVWVVGDATINNSETGTSFRQALFFMQTGFNLYDTMIWEKPSPQVPTEGRYYDVFEYMFIFSKGKPKSLNLLSDRKNVSMGNKGKKETRSNKEDRQYTGETRIVAEFSRRFNVWLITRGSSTTDHPAVFPEKLVADHIHSWSNEGDLIYDPFGGSGTTAKMAHLLNRKWILSEISKEYCEIAEKRILPHILQTRLF